MIKENDFLNAILLDFTAQDILNYLDRDYDAVKNITYRLNGKIHAGDVKRDFHKAFSIPMPRHELFPNSKYHYPFVLRRPFATMLTDYGCPFKCNFCIMGTIGFKYRSVGDVMLEIRHIKNLGFKDIYFNDQTFGVKRDRLIEFCEAMIIEKIKMGWVCWSRVDVVDEEVLKLMRKAGCHTILFGVETSNEQILKENNKGFTPTQVKTAFKLCKKLGIRTLGTFLLGLPNEDRESCLKTIRFAKEIQADFASFNVLVPRMNTKIRAQSIAEKKINKNVRIMDQSGNFVVMGSNKLSAEELIKLKDFANRSFYMNPSYILYRLSKIQTFYELRLLVMNGFVMLKKAFQFN